MSLQTGKPWMIERNEFIQSVNDWCKQPMANSNDRLIGSFVTIRLIGSEVFQLIRSSASRTKEDTLHNIESLLAILESELDKWELHWVPMVENGAYLRHDLLIHC